MTEEAYSKLILVALGPYCVMLMTMHAITVEQAGIQNTIFADQASLPPQPLRHSRRRAQPVITGHFG